MRKLRKAFGGAPGRTGAFVLLAALLAWTPPARAQDAGPDEESWSEQDRGDATLVGDQVIERGQVVQDVIVAGGDLRVRGNVEGDAVVLGGDLILEEGGRVMGDALVAGGRIIEEGGRVRGEMRTIDDISALAGRAAAGRADADREHGPRAEMREDHVERAIRHSAHAERSWFDPIKRGFAGVLSTLALGLVLAGLGAVLIFYGHSYLDTVSDTLRSSVLRSAAVGIAAGFLVIPGFVVLIVALAVSIVGIPFLLLAVPLYPLVVAAAVAMGLLGAAHALGERTAEQGTPFRTSYRNSYSYLFTGLAMLLAPLLAAHLLGMAGLGFVGTLLKVCTGAVIWAAATAGLGAVILSRAGTRRTFVNPLRDDTFAPDPVFDRDPFERGPDV